MLGHKSLFAARLAFAITLAALVSQFLPAAAGGTYAYIAVSGGSIADIRGGHSTIYALRGTSTGAFVPVVNGKLALDQSCTIAVADPLSNRVLLTLATGRARSGQVAQYEIGPTGRLSAVSPTILPDVMATYIAASQNGRHLYAGRFDNNSIATFSVTAQGGYTPTGTTTLPGASSQSLDDESADQHIYLAGELAINPVIKRAFVPVVRIPDYGDNAIYEFNVDVSGKLTPAIPFKVSTQGSSDLIVDSKRQVLYGPPAPIPMSGGGTIAVYAIGANGQLRPLKFPASVIPVGQSMDTPPPGLDATGNGSQDSVQIYPPPPLKVPEMSVSSILLDDGRSLLFGFGGENDNEIDVWQTSSSGPTGPPKRYWFNKKGLIPGTDPGAHASDSSGLPSYTMLAGTEDVGNGFLYVKQQNFGESASCAIYCFKILPGGKLRFVTNKAIKGIDLSNDLVSSFYVLQSGK